MAEKIDWKQVEEWDRKYRLHVEATDDEYQFAPIEHTEGDYLYTPDGTKLLDCLNQLICVTAGQRHPKIQVAIKEALDRYGFVWHAYTTDYVAKAAKLLVEDILGPYGWAGKVSFCSSGSEAVEKALIIAKLIKNRPNIVTREYAYHGWTMGAAGCNRVRGLRGGLSDPTQPDTMISVPNLPGGGFIVAPAPNCYGCSLGHTYPECKQADGTLACILTTQGLIETWGRETIAAMITEPVFGASAFVPPAEYLPQLVKMLHEYDIFWICDEVLTGFAKTGKWFAHQLFGDLKPDIMTMAKGMVSSALPAGGVVVSKEIADFMGKYRWMHVGTFNAHPLSMAAVCANLEVMIEENALEKAQKAGEYFGAKLKELEAKHRTLGLVSGSGVLWTVELVKNKKPKEWFIPGDRRIAYSGDISRHPSTIIGAKCREKGCILSGFSPNTLRIGFSVFVTKEDMNKAIDALDYALTYLDTLV